MCVVAVVVVVAEACVDKLTYIYLLSN